MRLVNAVIWKHNYFWINSLYVGKYPPPPGVTDVIGLEVAGDVAEVGENAKKSWAIGDKVMGTNYSIIIYIYKFIYLFKM